MKKLYSLYEGDTVIMRSVPAIHIREYLNIPSLKMADYTKNQKIIHGKYRITDDGFAEPEKKEKPVLNTIPKDMWEVWEEVCSRFKGIPGLDRIILVPER